MKSLTIWHNPRCSKSRQTLALLEEAEIDIHIVKYLETPPSQTEISSVLNKLGLTARELLRTKESEYKELGLNNKELSDQEIINAMATHPRLIERPIVISDTKAVIGRPPENVSSLIG